MGRPRDGRMIYICMYMQVSIYNRQFKKKLYAKRTYS
jgi:hypothetical protein